MKVLLINGSPKGKTSNSLKLASSFIEGVRDAIDNKEDFVVDELNLATMNIIPCKGCFVCWKNTPGVCCMKDDMQTVIEKELEADMVVWSFPLYYFNVPGLLKNLIDRQLPMVLPFMSEAKDQRDRVFTIPNAARSTTPTLRAITTDSSPIWSPPIRSSTVSVPSTRISPSTSVPTLRRR